MNFPDVGYEISKEDPSLAINFWKKFALIMNADSSSFGEGYIILEETPYSYALEEGGAKLLFNQVMRYDKALKEAKKICNSQ